MRDDSGIKWLFLDLNSYFAQTEQQDRPELRDKPVAVVPMDSDATCVIAASYEAKAMGVTTGTPIYEARRLCPELICVLARHDLYVDYHHRILSAVIGEAPINTVHSIDELSSRLPPNKRQPGGARALAGRIKAAIASQVGAYITCSIGLAPNEYLAKVASDMQKPDGLVTLEIDALPDALFGLALDDLPGINTNMQRRLNRQGIFHIHQFCNLAPKQARRLWGSVDGERLWYRLHGHEVEEPPTQRRMIGHSRVLDPELRTPEQARAVARRLCLKAAGRLRREALYAGALSLSVTSYAPDMPQTSNKWQAGLHFDPSVQDNFTLADAVHALWANMQAELRPARLKKVAVTLHELRHNGDMTGDLLATAAPGKQEQRDARDRLSQCMDTLNARFGAGTVHLGPTPRTRAGYVGTKIAFNRIPDSAEFRE